MMRRRYCMMPAACLWVLGAIVNPGVVLLWSLAAAAVVLPMSWWLRRKERTV